MIVILSTVKLKYITKTRKCVETAVDLSAQYFPNVQLGIKYISDNSSENVVYTILLYRLAKCSKLCCANTLK